MDSPDETFPAVIRRVVDDEWETAVRIAETLHADPETAWQEHRAHRLLTGLLQSRGFDVDARAGGLETAFHARVGSGPVHVGLIAEYDALPGLGHACGHNLIAATALTSALVLLRLQEEHKDLGLTVHVLGTPAEEGGGGKIHMLEAGEFDDLDAAMMIHPGPADVARAEPFAVAHWHVSYEGFGAHAAAYPEQGINAADAFTIAQAAVGLLRQQLPHTVRVHGVVTRAGSAPNAIPERAEGRWYVRAASLVELEETERRVRACFEAGAMATGCRLTIEDESPRYAEFTNDESLLERFVHHVERAGRPMPYRAEGAAGAMNRASTDMGNVSQRVRAIHPYLDVGSLPSVNHQRSFADSCIGLQAMNAVRDGVMGLVGVAAELDSGAA